MGKTVGVSVKVGGRERSDRWKGESEAFSLQKADVGTERADEPTCNDRGEGLGEEVHRRLSGHGFSPQERRAKEEFEVRFLAGEPNGLTNPSPSLSEPSRYIILRPGIAGVCEYLWGLAELDKLAQ
jgi:hypothetical protein